MPSRVTSRSVGFVAAAIRSTPPNRLAAVPGAPPYIGSQPRPIKGRASDIDHPLAESRYQTPLRYPGAKTGLSRIIGRLLNSAKQHPDVRRIDLLVEPFAGGASTSLRLVGDGTVGRVLLADADPLVAAFWQVAADETSRLIDRMYDEHERFVKKGGTSALDRWDYWRGWSPRAGTSERTARFEAAIKCLFLNRTTFSGILHGRAGPIGGRRQMSPYPIGCRFHPDALSERLAYVGHLYGTGRLIDVWCLDWEKTLDQVASIYKGLLPNNVAAYIDPPYLGKSAKLYQTSFDPHGGYAPAPVDDLHWSDKQMHYRLAEYLRRHIRFRWVLSYDTDPALTTDRKLYSLARMSPQQGERHWSGVHAWPITKRWVSLRYTASALKGRGAADELLVTTFPPSTVPVDSEFRMPR